MSPPPLAHALLCAFSGLVLGGCFAPEPKPDDWLAYGFRSPEATFHSYLTALAGDKPELEYRCLSQGMKEREGGTLLAYLTFRDQILGARPWLKAAARADIESVQRLGPDRARIEARVDWMFWDESFSVELVAEDFYEYWSDGERLEDGYHPFALRPAGESVVATVPAPVDSDLSDITELRYAREWKIDLIELPGAEP
jgi:hypothetical protein